MVNQLKMPLWASDSRMKNHVNVRYLIFVNIGYTVEAVMIYIVVRTEAIHIDISPMLQIFPLNHFSTLKARIVLSACLKLSC